MSVSPRRFDRGAGSPPPSADAETAAEPSAAVVSEPEPKPKSEPKACPHCQGKLGPHTDGERFHCDGCGCCFLKDGSLRPGHTACKPTLDKEAAEAEEAAKAEADKADKAAKAESARAAVAEKD